MTLPADEYHRSINAITTPTIPWRTITLCVHLLWVFNYHVLNVNLKHEGLSSTSFQEHNFVLLFFLRTTDFFVEIICHFKALLLFHFNRVNICKLAHTRLWYVDIRTNFTLKMAVAKSYHRNIFFSNQARMDNQPGDKKVGGENGRTTIVFKTTGNFEGLIKALTVFQVNEWLNVWKRLGWPQHDISSDE